MRACPHTARIVHTKQRLRVSPRSFGLGTVVITQLKGAVKYDYEFTEFRRDSYGRGGAHRPESVVFTHSIRSDALRRDFTINALYADMDGEVKDPTEKGLADLESKMVRMTHAQTMDEDALRILRMVRFACELGFEIDGETFDAAKRNVAKLDAISAERIRDEFFKIIMADKRYGKSGSVYRGLDLLRRLGAVEAVIPGISGGDGFAQSPKYHRYDVMEHLFRTCAAAYPDIRVRMAALLHDISKPEAYNRDGNMYGHAQMGAVAARNVLKRLKAGKQLSDDVVELVAAHMFDLDNSAREKTVIKMIPKLGKNQFVRLCRLREADFEGSGMDNEPRSAHKWREVLDRLESSKAPLSRSELAINGHDIMRELDIPPGKAVGGLLGKAHMHALKKPAQNNYKSLIRYVRMLYTGTAKDGSPS